MPPARLSLQVNRSLNRRSRQDLDEISDDEEQRGQDPGSPAAKKRRQIEFDSDHQEKNWDEKAEANGVQALFQGLLTRAAEEGEHGSSQKSAQDHLRTEQAGQDDEGEKEGYGGM